jgi:hypothetical protein
VLLSLAHTVRELGDSTLCRELDEEAYRTAPDEELRFAAAQARALEPTDLDDHIAWLERADQNAPIVRASLAEARGTKAQQRGKLDEAARFFRTALAEYTAVPENASVLNNTGLIQLNLYHITGDREDLDQGIARMERSIAMEPSSTIVMHNLASILLQRGIEDLCGEALAVKQQHADIELDLLRYLYRTEEERAQLAAQLVEHPSVVRAVEYLERLLVLRPRNPGPWKLLGKLHGYTRDVEVMRRLAARLADADLDLAESRRASLEYYEGVRDEKLRTDLAAEVARVREDLAAAEEGQRPLPVALAQSRLLEALLSGERVGLQVNGAELLELAEQAHALAPSRATESRLQTVLARRVVLDVARRHEGFARTLERAGRAVADPYVLAAVVEEDPELAPVIRKAPDFQRFIDLVLESHHAFPSSPDPLNWKLLLLAEQPEAAQVAAGIQANEVDRLRREMDLRLSPLATSPAYDTRWAAQAAGTPPPDTLTPLRTAGVPLP